MTSRLQARLLAQRALFQRLQNSKKRSKLQAGFTLIELLIVVIIIGVLAAIAIPNFLNQRDRAYEGSAKSWASGEARKCAASLAATGTDDDFAAGDQPDLTGSVVSVTSSGSCAGAATWTVTGVGGTTYTWTVTSAGGVSQS